jgi:uncharacterized YigZ family protein
LYSYKTIATASEGILKEKASKFYAFAFPVENEEEVKSKLDALRKKYFDARHHCYAYRVGAVGEKVRANDDGEPNHSAGDPILGQIRSKELTNILIVVVRYFGGVKLGVGGLIAAYRSAAEIAISNSKIVEKDILGRIGLTFDYAATAEVMKMVNEFSMTILNQSFVDRCTIELQFRMSLQAEILKRIKLLTALGKVELL